MYIRTDNYEIEQSPTANCFQVDDLIAPVISLLNRKGYKTAFCCSGHPNTDHDPELAYIAFEFGCITPETLPTDWYWVCDGQMEYEYKEATQMSISNVMSALLSWAIALPDTTI